MLKSIELRWPRRASNRKSPRRGLPPRKRAFHFEELEARWALAVPAVTSVTPFGIPGATVTVDGSGFTTATQVNFVSRATSVATPGTNLQIAGDTQLTVTAPATLDLGTYDVHVVNPDGTSPLNPTGDAFTDVSPAVVAVTHFTNAGNPVVSSVTTLNVTSTADFTPTGSLFVETTNGVATMTYTGVTATSFTGCTVGSTDPFHVGANDTTGTLNLTYPAVYQATNKTFNYTVQNQTKLAPSAASAVTYAMFWSSPVGAKFYYLDSPNADGSGGKFSPVTNLGTGGVLPTYTIANSGGTSTIALPYMPLNSARFVFGVGTAPSLVVTGGGGITTPDPNATNAYYDFIETTVDASGADNSVPLALRFLPTVNINTTQVDQFGFPITLTGMNNVNGTPVNTSVGVTLSTAVARDAIFSSYSSLHPSGSDPYAVLVKPSSNPSQPYRIENPGKVPLTTSMALGYVFDSVIQQLFETGPANLSLTSGTNTYTSTRTTVTIGPNTYNVLQFSGTGISAPVNVYEPFFSNNAPSPSSLSPVSYAGRPAALSWLTNPTETPGQMVFGNDGVFADSALQTGLDSGQRTVLGDLENQIVAAINRGIALLFHTTADWQNSANYYPAGQVANLYAQFLHQQAIAGTPIFIGGKAYAIGFDDQGGQNPSLVLLNQNSITASLGPWQTPPTPDQNAAYINALYHSVLNRAADANGLAFWLNQLSTGVSRGVVSLGFVTSLEYRTDLIDSYYTSLLHRSADTQGLNASLDFLASGGTQAQLKSIFFGSQEYYQVRGGGTNAGFIDVLFDDELGRPPSAQDQSFFSQLLAAGQSRTYVASLVIGSPEAEQDLVDGYYQAYLGRPSDPAGLTYWTGVLQHGNLEGVVQAGILSSTEYYNRA